MGVVFCLLPSSKNEYQEMAVVESIPNLLGKFWFCDIYLTPMYVLCCVHLVNVDNKLAYYKPWNVVVTERGEIAIKDAMKECTSKFKICNFYISKKTKK